MKILMVVTSHDPLGTTDLKTGLCPGPGQNPASSVPAAKSLLLSMTPVPAFGKNP